MSRMKTVLEFIDKRPRIILLAAWPAFTLCAVALTCAVVYAIPDLGLVVLLMKKLDILHAALIGVLAILGLNQLAQSSSFFGKVGMKLGSLVDVSADMDGSSEKPEQGREVQ